MADIAGLLDHLQGIIPEDAVLVRLEECAYAALAQAKSHVSLIHFTHFVFLLHKRRNQPVAAFAVTGWFVSFDIQERPEYLLVTASAL